MRNGGLLSDATGSASFLRLLLLALHMAGHMDVFSNSLHGTTREQKFSRPDLEGMDQRGVFGSATLTDVCTGARILGEQFKGTRFRFVGVRDRQPTIEFDS